MKVILPFRTTMALHNIYDGGHKYLDYFSKALAKQGVDVVVVTSSLENKKIKKKVIDGVKYVFLPPKIINKKIKLNMPYKLVFSYNLMKYLEKTDFDVLHSFEMLAYFYLHKPKSKRKPVITQPWGLEPFYSPVSTKQKGIKKLLIDLGVRHPWLYCMKKSDLVAAEGDFQHKLITNLKIPQNKIVNILIGADLKKIKEYKKNKKDKRKKMGLKKSDLIILSVCQIADDKGIEDIINAFSIVKKQIPNSKLIMIGSGNLETMMHKMVKKLRLEKDFFHFKNIPEKDLYDFFFSSDIYVNATTQHDFIMGVQEAMACGLPVVSSSQPFLVENGKNGFVVGVKNPDGIAGAIIKIHKKKVGKKMAKMGEEMVKKYDWDNVAKSAIEIYKKLIKKQLFSLF
jgi:glycosyltransferase involved in cell wall biosynthesis